MPKQPDPAPIEPASPTPSVSATPTQKLWPSGLQQLIRESGIAIALLLLACVALVWQAGAVMRYTQATADALHAPGTYVRAVMTAAPVAPSPAAAPETMPPGSKP
mgnify:CR=1 FL=1